MFKKLFSVLTVLIIFLGISKAQIIEKEILDKYPPGVIAKLYEIAKTIPIAKEQQIQLAEQFMATDNSLVENLKQNISLEEINKNLQVSSLKIYSILGRETIAYTAKKGDLFAKIASEGEIKYMQKAYPFDTIMYNKLRTVQYQKYKSLYQQYILYQANDIKAIDAVAKASKLYDSLSYSFYPTIYGGKYINQYVDTVKLLEPKIPDTTVVKLKRYMYLQTILHPYVDLGQSILDVMQHIYPDTTIISYFYKRPIQQQTKFLSSAEKYYLLNVQRVSENGFATIYPLVLKKNYQQVLLEYTYGANYRWRDSAITVSNKWYDSAITASLLRDGSMLSSNQFAIALKYKTVLQLRTTLTDTLLYHAMYLRQKQEAALAKDPFAKTDYKTYEAEQLNILLTEDQYTHLLTLKNSSQARIDAEEDWKDMVKWNVSTNFEEKNTKEQLYNYYLQKLNAFYRMANDKVKQEANASEIKELQPKALKILSAAKKLPKPVNGNTNINLKW